MVEPVLRFHRPKAAPQRAIAVSGALCCCSSSSHRSIARLLESYAAARFRQVIDSISGRNTGPGPLDSSGPRIIFKPPKVKVEFGADAKDSEGELDYEFDFKADKKTGKVKEITISITVTFKLNCLDARKSAAWNAQNCFMTFLHELAHTALGLSCWVACLFLTKRGGVDEADVGKFLSGCLDTCLRYTGGSITEPTPGELIARLIELWAVF